ncbi:hypothetical protein [Enterobacter hormaechei]|uniref:hypothetical protein n=1 Tax=Enterobacter hormaechei TaxID=158836 RepID=UPI0034D1615D
MSTTTKEKLIEDLKASTQNSSGLFEIGEETICELMALLTATPVPVSMKDHQVRELVNELRDIAVEHHGTQQLRERIARTIRAAMLQGKG